MTPRRIVLGAEEKKLLNDAAEWYLLSLLFSCPAPIWREQVARIASEIGDDSVRRIAGAALAEATEGLYHSVFGPGGPAPARQASYDHTIQLGQLLAALAAYYDAFDYHPPTEEILDHVAVEVGFVAYLRLKQAYALANSDTEHAAIAAEAARSFIEEHLSAIAAPLAGALGALRVGYLNDAGAELARRVGPPRHCSQKQSVAENTYGSCDDNCNLITPPQ